MPLNSLDADSAAGWLASLPPDRLTLIYKHSPACGISYDAVDEVRAFAEQAPDVAVYQVDVIRQRPLAQALARELHVTHHSPQVILLRGRTPVWHTSHSRIRAAALGEQVDSHRG